MDVKEFAVQETTKVAPIAGGVGWHWLGLPLEKWLTITLLVYGVLSIVFLLRDKWWRQRGSYRAKDKGTADRSRSE